MRFKIVFPTGYKIHDILNDNIDLNIILESCEVFFVTMFTIENIRMLIKNDESNYFWSVDMILVSNLKLETIRSTVEDIIQNDMLIEVGSKIGQIETVYSGDVTFEDLRDMSKGLYLIDGAFHNELKSPPWSDENSLINEKQR